MQRLQDKEPVSITTPQLVSYRGEIKAKFYYDTLDDIHNFYKVGDRICQLVIVPYPEIEFNEVDELSDSDRGLGGFGSSGN